jgi:ribosomal protein L11 methyltransferase
VWVLAPRPFNIGRLRILPAGAAAKPGALRLIDAAAFGTGLHPSTVLCVEALDRIVRGATPDAVLDVGTGSGILALSALMLGIPRALAIDTDAAALQVAAENARINGLESRLAAAHGGPDAVGGSWPLVLANILAAPLMDMAPALVRRVGHHGTLVLSGIHASLQDDVLRTYGRLGMRRVNGDQRAGWAALVMQASW